MYIDYLVYPCFRQRHVRLLLSRNATVHGDVRFLWQYGQIIDGLGPGVTEDVQVFPRDSARRVESQGATGEDDLKHNTGRKYTTQRLWNLIHGT